MTTTPNEPDHPKAFLAVLLMAPFLAQADATIANVATPAIAIGLGASAAAVELVIGGYLIAFAVLLITGARLGQTHGYKRLFVLGVVAFGLASLVCGLAPDMFVLVSARVVQGAAAALMFPQTLTGIQLSFTGDRRARAIGLYAIALGGGAITGQIFGGVLVSADIADTGWRPIFLINVPICAAVAVAAIRYLPIDQKRGTVRIDLLGVTTLTMSVLLVVVPLVLGRVQGWPAWTWVSLAASIPVSWLFLATQRRATADGRDPLVNAWVLARPAIAWGLLALLTATGTYYALLFTLAQYFQAGLGRGALASGLMLVPWVAAFGLAGQITRRLPDRLGPTVPFAGYLLLAAAYLAIGAALFGGRPSDALLGTLLALGGLGLGTAFATLIGHLTNAVPARYSPDISGVATTGLLIGGAVGVAAFGSVYLTLNPHAGQTQAGHAFALSCLAMGVTAVLAAAAAYASTHTRGGDAADVAGPRARQPPRGRPCPGTRSPHHARCHPSSSHLKHRF